MASSFYLKKESETFYRITYARQAIGVITKVDGKWNANLAKDNVRVQVQQFCTPENAFHAAILSLKCHRLSKNGGEFVAHDVVGMDSSSAEVASMNAVTHKYVAAFNKHNASDGRQLRVVTPRRRRY